MNFKFQEICEEALCIVIPESLLRSAPSAVDQLDLDGNSATNPLMISPDVLSSLPRIEPASMQGLYLNLKSLLNQYHIYPPRIIQTSNMVTAATMIKYGLGYMYISPIVLNLAHVEGAERPVSAGCLRCRNQGNIMWPIKGIIPIRLLSRKSLR